MQNACNSSNTIRKLS